MGILNDHCKRSSQVIFPDLADVNPVIRDHSALDLIKPVDQIDNRRLSRSGRSHKGNLLSRFCIERNSIQNPFIRHIGKYDIVKTHIAFQRCEHHLIFLLFPPCVFSRLLFTFHQNIPFSSYIAEGDGSFINLRFFLHHLENPLRTGKGRQQEIHLLCKLVHRHGALAHIDEIGRKAADIQ